METKEIVITPPEGFEVDEEISTFQKILFKKKGNGFSKDWKEFCKKHLIEKDEHYINNMSNIQKARYNDSRYETGDKNILPNKRFAEAFLALMQLVTIREKEYTKGWEPDWDDINDKYVLLMTNNEVRICVGRFISHPLSFHTRELAEEFLRNWKDLIEIAKPLL